MSPKQEHAQQMVSLEYQLVGLDVDLQAVIAALQGSGLHGSTSACRRLHRCRKVVRAVLCRMDGPISDLARRVLGEQEHDENDPDRHEHDSERDGSNWPLG